MEAIKDLLFRMADDELIIGHRNSEWTGIGPILEEDLAFSSMAQDKLGHALANYTMLEKEFGEKNPDGLAFAREEKNFRCCQLVEFPIGEYDFTLVRHFLFDYAEWCRYDLLQHSSFAPLAAYSKKIKGELKYHLLHADTWMIKLGNSTEVAHARMQSSLNEVFTMALSIFEAGNFEQELIDRKIFAGEVALQKMWEERIYPVLEKANLKIPAVKNSQQYFGGRKGLHTEHLQPLLKEMGEVIRTNTHTEW